MRTAPLGCHHSPEEDEIVKKAAPQPAQKGPGILPWILTLAGLADLTSLIAFFFARRRTTARNQTEPCRLPEQEIVLRLGGEHSGGCSAVMKF